MNNQQFRRLLLSDNAAHDGDKSKPAAAAAATPKAALGARRHSSIPMTPRQAGKGSVQADFARQLAERNAKANPASKPRSSAPKGTRLAAGYIDRTKQRTDDQDSDLAKRIKNLEESMKLGQIDRQTFESLVQEITGGHVDTTHLVRGLDRKLLDRVKRGEDVMRGESKEEDTVDQDSEVEDAFDELAGEEVGAIVRDRAEKKGEKIISPPPPVAGVKRSRNDILKDLKRQREEVAAATAAEHEKKFPTLGPGFRKITTQGETARVEIDDRGREVLIITAVDGKEKRKVRKSKVEEQSVPEVRHDLDDTAKPINMHNLPQAKQAESEDDDIFEGVGSNYNPLAHLNDEHDEDDEDDEDGMSEEDVAKSDFANQRIPPLVESSVSHVQPAQTSVDASDEENAAPMKRDYFQSASRAITNASSNASSADATVRAALAKVRNLDENSTLLQNLSSADPNNRDSEQARLKKRAVELAASDRDMEDMDLGFGASRFDDAEDMEREGEKVKFSQWKGLGADDDEEDDDGMKHSKKQRKRGPKKKRGDKNNAEDVLKVMERQKEKKMIG